MLLILTVLCLLCVCNAALQLGVGTTSQSSAICVGKTLDQDHIVDLVSTYLPIQQNTTFHNFWLVGATSTKEIERAVKHIQRIVNHGYTPVVIQSFNDEVYREREKAFVTIFDQVVLTPTVRNIVFIHYPEWNLYSNDFRTSQQYADKFVTFVTDLRNNSLNRNANHTKIVFGFINVFSTPDGPKAMRDIRKLFDGTFPIGQHLHLADYFGPVFKPGARFDDQAMDVDAINVDQMLHFMEYTYAQSAKESIIPYSYFIWRFGELKFPNSEERGVNFWKRWQEREAEFEAVGLRGLVLSGNFGKVSCGSGLLDPKSYDARRKCWEYPFHFSAPGLEYYRWLNKSETYV
jgi:hypothetical protein